jgi:hypothetical protein
MRRLRKGRLALLAPLFVLIFASQASTQQPAQDHKNAAGGGEVDRLLKSLDGGTWLVAETQYGLTYETGYLGLRQITRNTPSSEIGNKWYWMIYPLANIDHLWDNDIRLFHPQPDPNARGAIAQVSWDKVDSYVRNDQKCVYMLLPKMSVVAGRAGSRLRGRGFYDFGEYLRITELRVHKDKTVEFEEFAAKSMVPAASQVLPKAVKGAADKLPRYLRAVKLEVNMSKEPEFHQFLKLFLIPAAKRAKATVFVYHTIYGSEANYLLLFPFESETDFAATGERALSALWQKTYKYFDMLQVDTKFSSLIMTAHETIVKVRPDLSPKLENKYAKWWR